MSDSKQKAQRRLDELDARLGPGQGAARERKKLEAIIAGVRPKREQLKRPRSDQEPSKSSEQQAKESKKVVERKPDLDRMLGKALRQGDRKQSESKRRMDRRR